ncbi:hypothetical protein G4V62_03795 [Bacillaceae bacterium SIJ1]|uniref:flagellar biosynthetic protein FliO n=1 Tax=Litoribacterium kuwaitense TaxID=1398745 RepID=UPI0013EAC17F|nr:flagellar biosynthetic protein FliO [Litoribacterium kuwaitense]NGP44115.1 hypothetical protein [Litoribacterium kuwaitense]
MRLLKRHLNRTNVHVLKSFWVGFGITLLLIGSMPGVINATSQGNVKDWVNETPAKQDVENDAGAMTETPASEVPEHEVNKEDGSSLASDAIRALLSLAGVLALLYIILRLIKRKQQNGQSKGALASIAGLPLGQQRSIQLVQVGHSLFVLGVGQQVELIKEITDPEEIEMVLQQHDVNQNVKEIPFSKALASKLDEIKQQRKNISAGWRNNSGDSS